MLDAPHALFWVATALYACAGVSLAAYVARPVESRRSAGRWLVRAAFAAHTAALLLLAARSGSIPLNNVFESFVFLLWCLALVGIVVDRVYKQPMVSAFLLPLFAVLAVVAVCFVDDKAALPPGISMVWQIAHAVPILLAFALFGCACMASLMYLVQQRQLKAKSAIPLLSRLPPLEVLDKMSGQAIRWGFPLLTFGIVASVAWLKAGQQLSVPWQEDLKVWGACLTWAAYAAILHLRLHSRVHGKRVAVLTVLSFALVVATFVGDFMLGGRHAFLSAHPPQPGSSTSDARAVHHRT